MEHRLRLVHERQTLTQAWDSIDSQSEVEVAATSTDLTEAVREMLSRLPSDVFAAFRDAMAQGQGKEPDA